MNDVLFNYESSGEGNPPIVFIAGFTNDLNLWRPVAEIMSQHQHRVLIFDNQGIGQTKDSGEILTAENMADHIVDLYQFLEFEKPIVIGYAMGSTIAQMIALRHPDDLSALVLLSPVAKWSDAAIRKIENFIRLKYQGDPSEFYQYLYEVAFGPKFHAQHSLPEFIQMISSQQNIQSHKDALRQLNVIKTFDASHLAFQIKIPTLILSPEYDEFATTHDAEILAKLIEKKLVSMEILSGIGHAALDENPNLVIENILKFCTSLRVK